jgi:hypothetical protein
MSAATTPAWLPTIGKLAYVVERLPDGFAWRVARADGKAAYVVRREPLDRWECSCPAYRFGSAKRRAGCTARGDDPRHVDDVGPENGARWP